MAAAATPQPPPARSRRATREIGPRPDGERTLLSDRLSGAAQALAVLGLGIRSRGGNRPKFTFMGWKERGPSSMVSMWPAVMWLMSAPSAVVWAGLDRLPERSAAAKRPP
jgi:hypothetical protein